jgi:hypothetical protein
MNLNSLTVTVLKNHVTWQYCTSTFRISFRVTLRLTVSQSVSLGVEPTLWTFDQILLPFEEFVSGMVSCQRGHPTKTRKQIYIYIYIYVYINSVAWVRKRTIPTERPPPVGEVSANFWAPRGQSGGSLRPYSQISRPDVHMYYIYYILYLCIIYNKYFLFLANLQYILQWNNK